MNQMFLRRASRAKLDVAWLRPAVSGGFARRQRPKPHSGSKVGRTPQPTQQDGAHRSSLFSNHDGPLSLLIAADHSGLNHSEVVGPCGEDFVFAGGSKLSSATGQGTRP